MPGRHPVTTVLSTEAILGEGPVWCPRRQVLFWTDIDGKTFNQLDPGSEKSRSVQLDDMLCAFCLMPDGLFLCAFTKHIAIMDADGVQQTTLHAVEEQRADTRFNDGKCDPTGRFWAGTMSTVGTPNQGSLYRIDPDGSVHHMLEGLSTSNGLGWSPDAKTFYLTDSPTGNIYAFDFDAESGSLSNQRIFASVPQNAGRPDGLTVDAEGGIWSAHWDGWRITRYLPSGVIDQVIEMPVPRPTSVIFGGETMDTVFVTSARKKLDPDVLASAPLSGSVFSVRTDQTGIPEPLCSIANQPGGGSSKRL
jgi:sugar lactone lactonase YvrE